MSKKQSIIRVGDMVKITSPHTFLRCGYPLTTDMIIESHITPDQKELMVKLLRTAGYTASPLFDSSTYEYDKLERTFATILLKAKGWGGRERKVYTNYVQKHLDKIGTVHSKQYVKTGTYVDSSSSQGYYDAYPEYEPAYLKDEKTVIIYEVSINDYNGEFFREYVKFPHSALQKINPIKFDFKNIKMSKNSDEF